MAMALVNIPGNGANPDDIINLGGQPRKNVVEQVLVLMKDHPEGAFPVLNFINYQNDLVFVENAENMSNAFTSLRGTDTTDNKVIQSVCEKAYKGFAECPKTNELFANADCRPVKECLADLKQCLDPELQKPLIEELEKGFQAAAVTAANDLVFWTTFASAIVVISCGLKLYFIYQEISSAEAVKKEANRDLKLLEVEVQALKVNIQELQKELEFLDPSKQKTVHRIMIRITRLYRQHGEVYAKLGQVKVRVENKITRLEIRKTDAYANAFASGAQGITNTLPLLLRGISLLTPVTIFASILVTVGLGAVCIGSLTCAVLSKNRIKELQDVLDSVVDQQCELATLLAVLDRCNGTAERLDRD